MTKTDSKDIFESLPVPQAVKAMALPSIFGQLIVLVYNMADTFFVGRTNDPFMVAGASLILPVFNITLALAGLTGIGGGALISRRLGQGRTDEAGKVSAFSFHLAILIAGLFSVGTLLFMGPLLDLLGASENTFQFARQYAFCVIVLGGIPTVLSNVLSNFLRSAGQSGKAGFGVMMGGVINIFLDPLFMFVLMPRGSEVLGAGIATLLSNCISCAYFFLTIRALGDRTPIRFRFAMPDRESIRAIFGVGVPASVTTLLFDVDYVVIDKLMSAYGDAALAAVGIVLKAERLPLNIGVGLCQGMLPLVAYNYSAKNRERMNGVIRFSLTVGLICGAVSVAMYELFAGNILRVFIADGQTVTLGTNFLRARCLATPFMFLSFSTVSIFQGFGKGNTALFLGVSRWAVLNIPMLFLLNRIMGMYGLVWSQLAADVLTVTLSLTVYLRYIRTDAYREMI